MSEESDRERWGAYRLFVALTGVGVPCDLRARKTTEGQLDYFVQVIQPGVDLDLVLEATPFDREQIRSVIGGVGYGVELHIIPLEEEVTTREPNKQPEEARGGSDG